MRSLIVVAAAMAGAWVAAGDAAAVPAPRLAPQTAAPMIEQVRRCPPGYRKTMTGCARIRPRWWELLIL